MSNSANITRLLELADSGDPSASQQLLPLLYDELKRLAQSQLAQERPGNTLQPTALVHEAYLRLVGSGDVSWNNRGHFFGAAALAMRRILVERARHHGRLKRGGDRQRVELDVDALAVEPDPSAMLEIDAVLDRLSAYDRRKADVVMLRFFAGLTLDQTASAMGISVNEVRSEWTYARAWMHRELAKGGDPSILPG